MIVGASKRRAKVTPGDLIAIPLEKGHAIATVIYVSAIFRHVIALRVIARRFDAPATPEVGEATWLPRLLYTGSQSIPRHWNKVGTSEVSAAEQAATRRLIASDVWELDTNLGRPSASDLRELKSMGVLGMHGVQDVLDEQLP